MSLDERIGRAIDATIAPRVPVTPRIIAARLLWALLSLAVIYACGWYLAAILTPFGA